ncbi:unnamed protein product [Heligmosomoides polygyrus]|uniref:Endo/exonuclease/phosphatase domain-containing protein n=1 Tax=Heligmosomoides polygyrus TaxID=6339 RepID=A0A183GFW0_HELPZ|nr:unnamed protein product [Heligmosomoides polygyrus]
MRLRASTVFIAYDPTPDYDDEGVEAFYAELEKEDHTFYKIMVGDFNVTKGLKNFTSGSIDRSGTSKVKGCLSSSCRPRPLMEIAVA